MKTLKTTRFMEETGVLSSYRGPVAGTNPFHHVGFKMAGRHLQRYAHSS
jgi:hypothetical protein